MKKETGIAIFLGVAFGIILSLFMVMKTKDKQLETSKPLTTEKKIQKAVVDTVPQIQSFKITEPSDKSIVSTQTISVKGVADKDSLLVIQTPIRDITQTLKTSDFSIDIPLAMGENVIQFTIYAKNGQARAQQKELRIFYLDEK